MLANALKVLLNHAITKMKLLLHVSAPDWRNLQKWPPPGGVVKVKATLDQEDDSRIHIHVDDGYRWVGFFQAYSLLSTTHGHITDCKLYSVVYGGVCVWVNVDLSCLARTIYAQQFLGAKPLIQFRHRWAWWVERNHSDHLYWLQAA